MKALFKWLKRLAFGALVLITLVALAIAVENFRGHRAWEACKRDLEAKGEILDWRGFVPPPMPDDQNFFKTPLLAPLSDWVVDPATGHGVLRDTNAVERLRELFSGFGVALGVKPPATWKLAEFTDFAGWQQALRSATDSTNAAIRELLRTPVGRPEADLLTLLQQRSGELEELRAASRRPKAWAGVRFEDGPSALLPHLAKMKTFVQLFQVRALARLTAGDVDGAADDVETCLRLGRAMEEEPLLISSLVEMAMLDLSMQPLWEGLARHQWQEKHLGPFDAQLAQVNMMTTIHRTLRGERVCGLTGMDELGRMPLNALAPIQNGDHPESPSVMGMMMANFRLPSGWIDQNKVAIATMYQEVILPALTASNLTQVEASEVRINASRSHRTPYNILARMLTPAVSKASLKAVGLQTTLNLARLACAIERARLTDGAYPERLELLAPRWLATVPREVMNGEPYRYRRETSDRFVLYSIGTDLKDNGGAVAVDKKRRLQPGGDCAWQYQPVPVLVVTNTVTVSSK